MQHSKMNIAQEKEKSIIAAEEQVILYKETIIRGESNFSSAIIKAHGNGTISLRTYEERKSKILHYNKLLFKSKDKIKTFSDK